ncbi:Sec-independent protein translocase subunit TatA/TatB [Fodinibius halophilus]|uniref:Sec-independent protein translocase protein TatA n=1 Tax=Fodinibius halophilus TaxID=1736908 RepID=A0A6M1T1I5_9BACT|nr:twin-arginine translocase TatA/TatE family subunit [Fodinibius halophilus]NGP87857.1 twin-arginine translocase TatA/TatE family subunit [Fodinibius halophilus]
MNFGAPEILIILVVIILFFGARKIPELARGIGQGISEFRNATEDSEKELDEDSSESTDHTK